MILAIGSDHAGFPLKKVLKKYLEEKGYQLKDFGADSEDSVDYPDFAHILADAIEKSEAEMGVLMCGSGNGISMTANKHQGIRSALCWNREIAVLARQHNNANVLALPARFLSEEEAKEIVEAFLNEKFEGGRHKRRVNKISC
ncbi:MAG: ribose 5-phosphate isomerase B [Flavobacteriales bacterium]|nr:MAG: ribose 5-phosphate isomerase B [Flavobacteriales bacterium]